MTGYFPGTAHQLGMVSFVVQVHVELRSFEHLVGIGIDAKKKASALGTSCISLRIIGQRSEVICPLYSWLVRLLT